MTFLLLYLGSIQGILAQSNSNEIIPPAPEPAKLAEFALTPVGPYTGSQNFSIPIHTIDFDGMPINVSLSYRSGGIRASEDAGEVGLGWGLSWTGTISRVMQGGDDLLNGDNLDIGYPGNSVNDGLGRKGYVYDGHDVPVLPNDWANPAYAQFFHSEEASSIVGGNRDTEPDIFNLSFFGTSSKFVLSKLDEATNTVGVIKLSEDANKVVFDPDAQTFTVTNPEGFTGVFDIKAFSTGVSGSGSNRDLACGSRTVDFYQGIILGGRFRRITTWYLSKITSPNGRVLTFNYLGAEGLDPNDDIYVSMSANTFGEQRAVEHGAVIPTDGNISCSRSMQEHIYPASITSAELGIQVNFLTANRLDLKLPDFSLNASEYQWSVFPNFYKNKLDAGKIKAPLKVTGVLVTCDNEHSDLSRQITFQNEHYFNEDYAPAPTAGEEHQVYRLKLEGVQADDQVYRFDYFDGLPPKSSTGTDYWGFYNGKPDNQILIPAYVNPISLCGQVFGASFYKQHESRMANIDYGKAGLMYKVTYPTGGATQYEYESHEYQITEEEFFESGNPRAVAGASQGDQTSLNGVEYIGYFTHPEPGSTCIAPMILDVTLSYYPVWNLDDYEEVSAEDQYDHGVDVINAETGEIVQSFATWNRLLHNAEDMDDKAPAANQYRQTYSLELPKGIYKIRAKRKVDGDNKTKYYASASLTVPEVCTPQAYSEFAAKTLPAGGARIKSVTNFDEFGRATSRKSYKYAIRQYGQEFSSGRLMTPIRNVYISGRDNPENASNLAACSYMITSASAIPLSSAAQGGHIGYTRVEEIVENGQGTKTLGKTVYEYENIPNEIIQAQASLSNANVNGQLIRQTVFDNVETVPNPVKMTHYEDMVEDITEINALKYTLLPVVVDGVAQNTFQYGTSYTLKAQFVKPKLVTTTDYYENGKVEQSKQYEFNSDYLLKKETSQDSNGDIAVTEYFRPSDYASHSVALQKMIEKNQLSVIESVFKLNDQVVSASANHFTYDTDNDLILLDQQYNFNSDLGDFVQSTDGGSFGATYDPEESYLYDEKGNLIQMLNRAGVGTVYLWGYNKSLPVAEIRNATWDEVRNSLGQAAIDALEGPPDQAQLEQLKTDISGILITTMTHSPQIGLSSLTTPSGRVTYYKYDPYGRLSVIEDADGNVIKYFKYQYKETLDD